MKKFLASLLCLVMVFSMVACGSDEETKKPAAEDSTPTVAPDSGEKNETDTDKDTDKKDPDIEKLSDSTLGGKLALEFLKQIESSKDIKAIAEKLADDKFCGYSCATLEAKEGFLDGFDDEIKGFKNGYEFKPMIGSIPFVTFIFEAEDAAAFKKLLLSKANPRWNICTEAAETVCITSGNYVFFTMCPGEE